jgi:hypothetical protein
MMSMRVNVDDYRDGTDGRASLNLGRAEIIILVSSPQYHDWSIEIYKDRLGTSTSHYIGR